MQEAQRGHALDVAKTTSFGTQHIPNTVSVHPKVAAKGPPDMDNIHKWMNGIHEKFSANGNVEKIFPTCENSKNSHHLQKKLRG